MIPASEGKRTCAMAAGMHKATAVAIATRRITLPKRPPDMIGPVLAMLGDVTERRMRRLEGQSRPCTQSITPS